MSEDRVREIQQRVEKCIQVDDDGTEFFVKFQFPRGVELIGESDSREGAEEIAAFWKTHLDELLNSVNAYLLSRLQAAETEVVALTALLTGVHYPYHLRHMEKENK